MLPEWQTLTHHLSGTQPVGGWVWMEYTTITAGVSNRIIPTWSRVNAASINLIINIITDTIIEWYQQQHHTTMLLTYIIMLCYCYAIIMPCWYYVERRLSFADAIIMLLLCYACSRFIADDICELLIFFRCFLLLLLFHVAFYYAFHGAIIFIVCVKYQR